MTQAKYVGASQADYGKVIKFGNKETNPNVAAVGLTIGEFKTYNVNMKDGREFMQSDIDYAGRVCILGYDVYDKLFPDNDAVAQIIRISDQPVKVIGVMAKRPQIFGQSQDNFVLIPITTYQSFYGQKTKA